MLSECAGVVAGGAAVVRLADQSPSCGQAFVFAVSGPERAGGKLGCAVERHSCTRFRVDMLWPDAQLILEIDGMAKYGDAEFRREKRREHQLRRLGYRVERVTWDDIVNKWPETRAWLRAALSLGPGSG